MLSNYFEYSKQLYGAPQVAKGKKSAYLFRRCRLDPWVRKIPRKRKIKPTPVFLPGEFHGQKSLGGFSPWYCKGSNTAEQQSMCIKIKMKLLKNKL